MPSVDRACTVRDFMVQRRFPEIQIMTIVSVTYKVSYVCTVWGIYCMHRFLHSVFLPLFAIYSWCFYVDGNSRSDYCNIDIFYIRVFFFLLFQYILLLNSAD